MDAADATDIVTDPETRAVLDRLRVLCDEIDPVPDDLVATIGFALEKAEPGTEFLRSAARRENGRSRVRVFDGTDTTVLLAVTESGGVTVRLDGWVAPAGACRVRLRTAAGVLEVSATAAGRFTYKSVRRGLAQISLCRNRSVATPALVL